MPIKKKRRTRSPISPGAYALFFGAFTAIVLVSHAPFLDLPFFWDEVGQFVPAALDLYHSGALVPHSVTPNAHPPGVMAYLAFVWALAGYSVTATRVAMLLLAGASVLATFLLAVKLSSEVRGVPALLVTLLLCCSPLFYAQAMLAQLDMPAMLFTILALLLFLEDRMLLAALACVALVLVKETGIVTPLLLGFWIAIERRYQEARYFLLPAVALLVWLLYLRYETGYLFGSAGFTHYNLTYMLHPVRSAVALARRIYQVCWENVHWVGAFGVLFAWVHGDVFESRAWRLAWSLVAVHMVLFSLLGGAMLERYLLPVIPIIYIAMIAGWSAAPSPWRVIGPMALIFGVAVSNLWNPPYPFPLENNLAFTEFVKLQQTAAKFIEERYPTREISTAWPFSAELARPELGYVKTPHRVREIVDFSDAAVTALDARPVDVFVLYSRQWDPPNNLLRNEALGKLWRRFFQYEPQTSPGEIDARFGLKVVAGWVHKGHWIEVHARE